MTFRIYTINVIDVGDLGHSLSRDAGMVIRHRECHSIEIFTVVGKVPKHYLEVILGNVSRTGYYASFQGSSVL